MVKGFKLENKQMIEQPRSGAKILGAFIDALSWEEALTKITNWVAKRESRYICICNVHSVVTASQDSNFKRVVDSADMATPDGMPVAWALRKLGFSFQQRINGPDLMWKYCAKAEKTGQSIFLYGNTQETLNILEKKLRLVFPRLNIAGMFSPPFRAATQAEDNQIIEKINNSGAGVVFVSLGCPKQEIWMAEHRGRIQAVMIGVGAAFDYHAGTIKRAPLWMQNNGLEWLHRLCSEPRRLWKRYFVTNTLFLVKISRQLLIKEK